MSEGRQEKGGTRNNKESVMTGKSGSEAEESRTYETLKGLED